MKRLTPFLVLPLLFAPIGYLLGLQLLEKPPSDEVLVTDSSKPQEIVYKMPLGGLTIQVIQLGSIIHIVLDLDVYIAGATEFERLSGSEGKVMLRDAAIMAVSDLAETYFWVKDGQEASITGEDLAKQIAHKLFRKFNAVRATRVNNLNVARTDRN